MIDTTGNDDFALEGTSGLPEKLSNVTGNASSSIHPSAWSSTDSSLHVFLHVNVLRKVATRLGERGFEHILKGQIERYRDALAELARY